MTDLPTPVVEPTTEPFWDAVKRGVLGAQRCVSCSTLRFPPQPMCPQCHSLGAEWAQLSGRGTVFSYIVSRQAIHPALVDRVPFATVIVELDEGVRMVSNLVDVDPDTIQIGMPVRFVAVELDDGTWLPQFERAS